MKITNFIENSIINLINKNLSEDVSNITMLPASGSSRIYFRIHTNKKSLIATYNPNTEENNAFIIFSKHFRNIGLPVPEILAISEDKSLYIQSDLGDISLFDYVKKCIENKHYDETTIELYKKAISNLVDFQIKGHNKLDYSVAYPTASFDKRSILDDLNYFKYYFLKVNEEIHFNETRLNADFIELANIAMQAPSDFFMYRDFQSRNIMIKDDSTFFIDYQGGRKGPLQYDIVSLLYQVKAQIPNKLRHTLLTYYKEKLSYYLNVEEIEFDKYYKLFVLIRLLQVLGAYGYRGLIQKKSHFIESIPYALKEISLLSEDLNLPSKLKELSSVLSQLKNIIEKYEHHDSDTLTVVINSFSYKNGGIPFDKSCNGGGFAFDCRALPNPGRYTEYKKLTGEDAEVQDFLNKKTEVNNFLNSVYSIVSQSIDNYLQRDFKNLSVNFGCTGGQHRSVYLAQKTAEYIHEKYPQIRIVLNHTVQHKNYIYEQQ